MINSLEISKEHFAHGRFRQQHFLAIPQHHRNNRMEGVLPIFVFIRIRSRVLVGGRVIPRMRFLPLLSTTVTRKVPIGIIVFVILCLRSSRLSAWIACAFYRLILTFLLLLLLLQWRRVNFYRLSRWSRRSLLLLCTCIFITTTRNNISVYFLLHMS